MKQKTAVVAGVVAGAVAAFFLRERRGAGERSPAAADPRAEELRRKLAEAREGAADEEDFEVAGMGAETVVGEAGADEDLEAERRRVHAEGRAAADEMRRAAESEDA